MSDSNKMDTDPSSNSSSSTSDNKMEVEPKPSNPSSPSSSSSSSSSSSNSVRSGNEEARQKARELFQAYVEQLTKGCGRKEPHNKDCASDPNHVNLNAQQAGQRAIQLMQAKAPFCIRLPTTSTTPTSSSSSSSSSTPITSSSSSSSSASSSSSSSSSSTSSSGVAASFDSSPLLSSSGELKPPNAVSLSPAASPVSPSLSSSSSSPSAPSPAKPSPPPLSLSELRVLINDIHSTKQTGELIKRITEVFADIESISHSFDQPVIEEAELQKSSSFPPTSSSSSSSSSTSTSSTSSASSSSSSSSTSTSSSSSPSVSPAPTPSPSPVPSSDSSSSSSSSSSSYTPSVSLAITSRFAEPSPIVNLKNIDEGWELLSSFENESISESIRKALLGAFRRLFMTYVSKANSSAIDLPLPQLLSLPIILETPLWLETESHDTLKLLCKVIGSLSKKCKNALITWYIEWPLTRLEKLIGILQQYITVSYYLGNVKLGDILVASRTLGILYHANNKKKLKYPALKNLSYELWYNDVVNNDINLIKDDFRRWKSGHDCFVRYPYMMDAASKSHLIRWDAQLQMERHFREAYVNAMFSSVRETPYLVLKVNRERLIPDTLQQLQSKTTWDFKKPLKVVFENESGIDEGGLRKEFFQLIVSQIFNPQYGIFVADQETRTFKFNPNSFESSQEFELIGIVVGLAIYNAIILDLHLDPYIYKMLLDEKPNFDDFMNTYPDLANGFIQLLNFDGDVENTYMRNFTCEYEVFGETLLHELKPNGKNIPLTNANRQEYVDLFVEWKLEKSISKQFGAFREGFLMVCGGEALALFRSEELQLLICGSDDLDFEALQAATRYDDGFDENSPAVRNFWEIVHTMTPEEKRKLLFFCTGSDRVPIRGLGNFPFTISRQGPDSDQLPTSHTCFNHLLFPEYPTKEKLQRMLKLALEHAHGFGLI